jgi:hypothetical protein
VRAIIWDASDSGGTRSAPIIMRSFRFRAELKSIQNRLDIIEERWRKFLSQYERKSKKIF